MKFHEVFVDIFDNPKSSKLKPYPSQYLIDSKKRRLKFQVELCKISK